MADSQRKLTVTSTKVITTGQGTKGAWTLYEVFALGEDGQPVEAKLKSFADLTQNLNKLVAYAVEKQDHEQYGTSFLLKPPRKAGASLGPKVDELRVRIEQLEKAVAEIRAGQVAPAVPTSPPAAPAPAPGPVPAAATSDDDIPF